MTVVILATSLSCHACGGRKRDEAGRPGEGTSPGSSWPVVSTPPSAAADASASVYVPPPQKPLYGLFCEGDEGLWRLREDGETEPVLAIWPSIHSAEPRSPGSAREGSLGPDGSLYISTTPGILRLGAPMVAPWYFPALDSIDREKRPTGDFLAFGRGVMLWGAFNLFESAEFPPKRVEDFQKVTLPGNAGSIIGVVYDAKQRLWVATRDAVHVRENETWSKAELPAYPNVKGLAIWQGVAHVLLEPKLAAYPDGPSTPKVVAELPGSAETMVSGKHGLAILLEPPSGKRGGRVVRFDGGPPKTLPGTLDRLFAFDDNAMIWGREKEGFAAIDDKGNHTVWPKGSIPAFSRAFTQYCHVAKGYDKLPVVNPIRRGNARGVFTRGGTPVANARVDLCEYPPTFSFTTKTPCGGYGVSGKTDAAGAFSFENIPIGKYHALVELGDSWRGTGTLGSHKLPPVTEAGDADFSTIDIK